MKRLLKQLSCSRKYAEVRAVEGYSVIDCLLIHGSLTQCGDKIAVEGVSHCNGCVLLQHHAVRSGK